MGSSVLDINKIKLLKRQFGNRYQRLLKQRQRELSSEDLRILESLKQEKIKKGELQEKTKKYFKKLTKIDEKEKIFSKIKDINTRNKKSLTAVSSIALREEIESLKSIILEQSNNIKSAGKIVSEEWILSQDIPLDPSEIKESQENIEIAITEAELSSNILTEALERIEFLSQFANDRQNILMQQELLALQSSLSTLEESLKNTDSIIQQSRQINLKKHQKNKATEDLVKTKRYEIQQLLDQIENYQEDLEDIFNKAKEKLKTDTTRKGLVKEFFESSQDHLARIYRLIESETFGKSQVSLKHLETLLNRASEDITRTGKELAALFPDKSIRSMLGKWITKVVRLIEDIGFAFSLPNISQHQKHRSAQEHHLIKDALLTSENNNPQQTFIEAFKKKAKLLKNASNRLSFEQRKLERPKNPKKK